MTKPQKFLKISVFILVLALCRPSSAGAEAMTSSFAKLIAAGQSVACSYEKTDENGSQKGTVYVAQNKMRGEFNVSTKNEGAFPMHMIHDGEWMYTWGGPMGETQGMKIKPPPPGATSGPGHSGPDVNEDIKMDCNPWPVDESKFNLPANVDFQELNMGGMGAGGMDMKALQCAACDQAPAEEQSQCRQMLGCS